MTQRTASPMNWVNAIFFTVTPLVAIIGTLLLIIYHQIAWPTILLAIVYITLTGLGITAGYHRLFAHRTYKASRPLKLLFLLFGAAAFQGSVLEWSTDHREHHLHTDSKEKDPYSITRGFWFAHIGWILHLDESKRDFSNVKDLAADPLIAWQHKHIMSISIIMSFIVPTLIAALWGNALAGLIVAGVLRLTINHHFTFFINSAAHYFGTQTYSDRFSARDNWLLSLVTYGEGFHNFHHQFALDYRNGVRWHHFDPSKWLIFALSKFGLCSDLKRVSNKIIVEKRIEQQLKQLQLSHSTSKAYIDEVLMPIRERLRSLYERLDELKKNRMKMPDYHLRIKELKKQLRNTYKEWRQMIDSISLAHGSTA